MRVLADCFVWISGCQAPGEYGSWRGVGKSIGEVFAEGLVLHVVRRVRPPVP